jgi:hypothetical protein
MILLEVEVNGEAKNFLVDTGAAATLVGKHLAEELDLKQDRKLSGMGAGGEAEFSLARVDSLAVGGIVVRDLSCIVGDLDPINARLGGGLDGVLGFDFLSRCRITIDYQTLHLTFEPYGDQPSRPNAFVIDGRHYRNDSWGVAVDRPGPEWGFLTETPLPTTLLILQRSGKPAQATLDVMEVQGLTIQQLVPSIEASLALQFDHYEKMEAEEVIVAGEPAHRVEFEGTREETRLRCRYYGFKKDAVSYSILFESPLEVFPELVGEFEAIMDSVELVSTDAQES